MSINVQEAISVVLHQASNSTPQQEIQLNCYWETRKIYIFSTQPSHVSHVNVSVNNVYIL